MEKLDELLKLEKAANLVCIKYDKMANAYEQQSYFVGKNDIEYDELQKKYKKCNKIHSKIIDDIEIEQAKQNSLVNIITLGKRILRTETAPLVISSNILYELED